MPRGTPNSPKANQLDIEQPTTDPYIPIFLQSIRDALPNLRLHSDKQLTVRIGKEKVADVALELRAFLQSGAGDLRKNEQLALSNQALKCLSKYITTTLKIPVTLKTLLDSFSLLNVAVDQAFPGYADSKLLKFAILPVSA